MTEETIFAEALKQSSSSDRIAYLDQACIDDPVLRRRIDTLLKSHEADDNILGKPAIQCAAEEFAGRACAEETQGEVPADEGGDAAFDFLVPSEKAGALGRLGHYEVLETIGRGGMGIVLRAFDENLHRVVAIKVMAGQLATNANARKRFTREARAAAAVTHDHLVTIHAVEEGNGLPYLVMQFVSGMSLQQRLDRHGPLQLTEIVRIGMQTAAGLAAAHAHGLIHRDIKPANILLENGVERVKITDFGLARAVADASLTQSGVVAGTPQYMSPEQARGEGVDQRTDLFSLGSVVYAMCTGRPPFRADSSMAVLKRVCDDTPSVIRATNPEIPDWLVAIVTKLHAKDPADRFQTAAEVAELLKDHLAHLQHPSVVGPVAGNLTIPFGRQAGGEAAVGQPAPRGRRRRVMAAALLLCLIGGLGFTEATGVTNVRATVIRIFTPDGTLIVEVDDPGVKVTIEGDGGIVITGAGLHEVRLKPGSYKVQAAKDGKPVRLDQELVTITRGDKQVVRVSREPPGQALASGEVRRFVGHTHEIQSVAFSSDGRYVVTASGNSAPKQPGPPGARDYTVRLWDVKTGKELRRFAGHDAAVFGVAISADGQRILSCDGISVRLWDAATGHELHRFRHEFIVYTVAFSPDGRYAASGGGDNDGKGISLDCDVHLWDVESGKELRRFKGHTYGIRSLAFSPDGRHLLTGSLGLDNTMRLWDVETGNEVRRFHGHTHWVAGVAFSRDGRHAVSASFDKTARVWEVETGKELKRFEVPQRVNSVAFSPDGRRVLTGTAEGVMYLWDLQTGKELRRYEGMCVAISPDGRQALSGDDDGRVRLWELPEPVAEAKAFVLLGGKGVAERNFDTLAEAVQGASNGDTIEIRGNGPFVSDRVDIRQSLVIRAGAGYAPSITLSQATAESNLPLLNISAPLVLEGLELRHMGGSPKPIEDRWPVLLVASHHGALHIGNCRLIFKADAPYVGWPFNAAVKSLSLRNSVLSGNVDGTSWRYVSGGRCTIENCVSAVGGIGFSNADQDVRDVAIRVRGNTLVGNCLTLVTFGKLMVPQAGEATPPIRLELSGNVARWDVTTRNKGFLFLHQDLLKEPVSAAQAELFLLRLVALDEKQNVYKTGTPMLRLMAHWQFLEGKRGQDLADWDRFWAQKNTGSLEGDIRFQGGDLVTRAQTAPEKLTAEDFRLRPDSAGYRAGNDGKDLGADIDLVGPGPAYERWKKTPEYQQWLKETKQVTKAEASTVEPKAFVVLTGNGVVVRRYGTLAEAVRGAIDGDTIEIHGNGPFVTEPIDIKNQSLIIRAGEGYRPVLKQTAEAVEKCLPLLETSAPLVLEGLELQQVSQTNRAGGLRSMLISRDAPLWLANCQLFMKDQQQHCVSALYCPTVELRNCEFFINGQGLLWLVDKSSKCLVSNCVLAGAGGNMLGLSSGRPGAREALVRLERNTLVTSTWGLVHLGVGGVLSPKHWGLSPEHKLVRIKAADNILDAKSALTFSQNPETPPQELWSAIKSQEAETAFRTMIQWDDGRNVFAPGASSIDWLISGAFEPPHGPKSLASWKRFWGNLNADALEGQVRYQGGNRSDLLASGPEKLTAEHFRLRPDSTGYRAGKDGKDLGADVDLVGPGPAYERWKKTPAYQQWLKDSGQVKK